MIEFKKYSSIENSFNREFLEYVVAQMPADLQYVVQEKVHGANTSFLCDGHEVKFAKRTLAFNMIVYCTSVFLWRFTSAFCGIIDNLLFST